jgi:hypothetical protein
MILFLLILALLGWCAGCSPEGPGSREESGSGGRERAPEKETAGEKESTGKPGEKETVSEKPATCKTKVDTERLDGKKVLLVGTYRQIDVRMRRKPPPVYRGHVAIVLEDGTEVLLEPVWKKTAIRPPDEIARFDNKAVRVLGTIHKVAPECPEPTANLLLPCMTDIESIELQP